jgi:hypothetical protein
MLDSLERTTKGYDVEVIAIIDRDLETLQIARNRRLKVDFGLTMRGGVFCWNMGLVLSSGDIIVPSGDDQLFYDGWLDYALESHEKQLGGSGVVGMNDLAYDGNLQLATMFIFDRQYCKDYMGGVIAPPVYNYYCVDSEINSKAKSLGKFYWDKRAIVEHLHSAHGKRPMDDHDLFRDTHGYMVEDNKIFRDREARGFPIEWNSLI